MKAVFADSFHFLALLNRDEPAHARAMLEHRRKWQNIVTTDCIILEIGDALCAPRDHDDFLALYKSLQADARIKKGIRGFEERADKDWPLTDCISFVVMEESGLRDALTADQHFEQAGFKALLK